MPRNPNLAERHSGLARGTTEACANPLRLVSRPLYLPTNSSPKIAKTSWEQYWAVFDPNQYYLADHDDNAVELGKTEFPQPPNGKSCEYMRVVTHEKAFVVGGANFVSEMGLKLGWQLVQANRDDAKKNIANRNWSAKLDEIKGKESKDSIFGIGDFREFYRTLPKLVERDDDRSSVSLKSSALWRKHRLRLRKAIEFTAISEATLQYRLSHGKSIKRFRKFLGEPNAAPDASRIYDVVWFEPVIYTIWPALGEPKTELAAEIMKIEEARALYRDTAPIGEDLSLYWLLMGMPGRLASVQAACNVCNLVYRDSPLPFRAVTLTHSAFTKNAAFANPKSQEQKAAPREYRNKLETLSTHCPSQLETT